MPLNVTVLGYPDEAHLRMQVVSANRPPQFVESQAFRAGGCINADNGGLRIAENR